MAQPITKEIRVTMACSQGCRNQFRIGYFGIIIASLPYKFCPTCGKEGVVVSQDMNVTYWEALAESYGYTVEDMKQIYSLWEPREHTRFGDFLNELKAEVADLAAKDPAQ